MLLESGSCSNWKNICCYEGLPTGWKQRNGCTRGNECCWLNDLVLCCDRWELRRKNKKNKIKASRNWYTIYMGKHYQSNEYFTRNVNESIYVIQHKKSPNSANPKKYTNSIWKFVLLMNSYVSQKSHMRIWDLLKNDISC